MRTFRYTLKTKSFRIRYKTWHIIELYMYFLTSSAKMFLKDRLCTYSEKLCRQLFRSPVNIQLLSKFHLRLIKCYIFHDHSYFYLPIWQMSLLIHLTNSKTDLKKEIKYDYIYCHRVTGGKKSKQLRQSFYLELCCACFLKGNLLELRKF